MMPNMNASLVSHGMAMFEFHDLSLLDYVVQHAECE